MWWALGALAFGVVFFYRWESAKKTADLAYEFAMGDPARLTKLEEEVARLRAMLAIAEESHPLQTTSAAPPSPPRQD